jgi:hypothetical protein
MNKPNKPVFNIPDDLFEDAKREAKVAAVQKLATKEPARVFNLVKTLINKDKK